MDRLLAIWQGIHSNDPDGISWWKSELHADGTFVEPANENETPATPLAPFRKALNDAGNPTWWQAVDVRDYLSLGYDYPQTLAARKSGNLAAGLTAWANAELGWVTPQGGGNAGQPDHDDQVHLQQDVKQYVPAFPPQVLLDGTTPLDPDEQYISSSAQPVAPTAAAHQLVLQKAIKRAVPTAKPNFNDRFANLGNLVSQGEMTQWNATFGVDK